MFSSNPDKKSDLQEGKGGNFPAILRESDCGRLADVIVNLPGVKKSVLLAAASPKDMPIIIAVKVSIELAKTNKVLLIDLDTKRDAAVKVFDLGDKVDTDKHIRPRAYKSPFENLMIWPASNFAKTSQTAMTKLVKAALVKFEYVIINAPYICECNERKQLLNSARYAFIFAESEEQAKEISNLLGHFTLKIAGVYTVKAC